MKKIIIIVIILVIIGVIIARSNKSTPTTETMNNQTTSDLSNIPIDKNLPPVPQIVTVTYSDAGFSPATVTINVNDTVTFKNTSTHAVWPASNDHPSHLLYPEFDPKRGVAAGESWSFAFVRPGSWGYHNHMKSSQTGTVIVK